MDDKKFFVYVHTNKINNKKYVGITSKERPELRWGKNGYGYANSVFYNAIVKYGWDNFDHDVLYSNLSLQEASEIEAKLIKDLKTQDNRFGYNIADGGYHFIGTVAKQKLQELSEQRKIKVIRLNDCKIYDSITDAEQDSGVPNSNIIKCCKGSRWQAGTMPNGDPMIWYYYDENVDYTNMFNEHMILKSNSAKNHKNNRAVVCVNTGEVFDTLTLAEKKYNTFVEDIIKCCKGCYQYSGKDENGVRLRWMYYNDWIKLSKQQQDDCRTKEVRHPFAKKIKCVEDNIVFQSIKDAQKHYNLNYPVSISRQLNNKQNYVWVDNQTRPIHFIYCDE